MSSRLASAASAPADSQQLVSSGSSRLGRVKSLKSTVAAGVRRVLPLDSKPRRIIAGTNQGLRAGSAEFRDVVEQPGLPAGATPGLASYDAWRRQQRKLSHPESELRSTTSFAIVIEVPEGTPATLVAKTRRSIAEQLSVSASVHEVATGTPFEQLFGAVTADFLLFLQAGSTLAPHAIADIAKAHREDPALGMIAFDSDLESALGRVHDPLFRASWSPEMMLGTNYLGRAFAIKLSLARKVRGAALGDTGVWQLLLDAGLDSRTVGSVNRVLLTEKTRSVPHATSTDARMVREALAQRGETAETSVQNGIVRVRFTPEVWPTVSVVIPTRHSRANLARLLPTLAGTDYPHFDVAIIDNGGESDERNAWYAENANGLDLSVQWWTESPFNYSRVNNVAARSTAGEIVLMLNDDTAVVDAGWMKEMVGLLLRDGVGTVGVQHLNGDGAVQHGGVMVGPGGFADNLFTGMAPNSDTIIGSTDWYRNTLAVTGACVAIRRSDFEEVGGLDERFILCGSDVVLGLDQVIRGRRNAVVPFDVVRHYESVTRGTAVPAEDFYASYWRYNPWLQNGDPYVSPNVSQLSAVPRFKSNRDPNPIKLSLAAIGRPFTKVKQGSSISEEATGLVHQASISPAGVRAVHEQHASVDGFAGVKTVNWFVPDLDMPFFGGVNTAFRLADKLAREQGVVNRFVMLAAPNHEFFRSALAAAFPGLGSSEILFYNGTDESIAALPEADAAVATLWLTAVHVAKAQGVRRKFYLMQDYEPGFYPASTMYAMAEESYKLGLYAICNTQSMHKIYTEMYGGKATYFTPAVDRAVFHPEGRRVKGDDEPVTIFAYARDHFRNCWELVYAALSEIKRIHGDDVRIVAAGARYLPGSADFIDMGLLDFRATGALYRETDIGLTMQISRHPSYLPLELMGSGVPMVAPDSDWFTWLFEPEQNSLVSMRTLEGLVEQLDTLVRDKQLRMKLQAGAIETIDSRHGDWDAALSHVYAYMCDPEGAALPQ